MTEKLQNALNEQITAEYGLPTCIYQCLFIWKERAFPEWLAGCRNSLQKRPGMHMPLPGT